MMRTRTPYHSYSICNVPGLRALLSEACNRSRANNRPREVAPLSSRRVGFGNAPDQIEPRAPQVIALRPLDTLAATAHKTAMDQHRRYAIKGIGSAQTMQETYVRGLCRATRN